MSIRMMPLLKRNNVTPRKRHFSQIEKCLFFYLHAPPNAKKKHLKRDASLDSGSDLSSRTVSSQVLSALKGLTSVFGMGTGGTPSSLPPEIVNLLILRAPDLSVKFP